jgi:hypothetical protein
MASDPLCRALTPSEQQWLPQSSLIALAGVLSAESTLDVAGLRAAAQRVAAGQPYLQIRIDAENVCYARNDGVPVTGEILADDDADDDADDTRAALRAAVARQLAVGVDRGVCLARAHLVDGVPGGGGGAGGGGKKKILILIADHLCFDGRSVMQLFESICDVVAANKADGDGVAAAADDGTMLDFIEWTSRIPDDVHFPAPFQPPFETVRLKPKDNALPPAELAQSLVEDLVVRVPAATMAALKARAQAKRTTLNAPLMAAFLAAAAAAAARRDPEGVLSSAPSNVRACCAVDLRQTLGLARSYMNNSSSVVPVHGVMPALDTVNAASLWSAAVETQQVMLDHIAANEAFRLQDITKGARFAEFGPYFDILCLWSNMGLFRGKGVDHVECHLRGAGSNPIVSGHPITCAHGDTGEMTLSLTLTFSPGVHARETVEFMGATFVRFVGMLAEGAGATEAVQGEGTPM